VGVEFQKSLFWIEGSGRGFKAREVLLRFSVLN